MVIGGIERGRLAAASVVLAVGLGIGSCARGGDDGAPDLGLVPGEPQTLRGVVVENSIDPCLFPDEHREPCVTDAGEYLVLDVDGAEVRVHYGGGEWPPCDNVEALRQGEEARVGTTVEVFAEAAETDHHASADLDTCDSPEYYIAAVG